MAKLPTRDEIIRIIRRNLHVTLWEMRVRMELIEADVSAKYRVPFQPSAALRRMLKYRWN